MPSNIIRRALSVVDTVEKKRKHRQRSGLHSIAALGRTHYSIGQKRRTPQAAGYSTPLLHCSIEAYWVRSMQWEGYGFLLNTTV